MHSHSLCFIGRGLFFRVGAPLQNLDSGLIFFSLVQCFTFLSLARTGFQLIFWLSHSGTVHRQRNNTVSKLIFRPLKNPFYKNTLKISTWLWIWQDLDQSLIGMIFFITRELLGNFLKIFLSKDQEKGMKGFDGLKYSGQNRSTG